MQKRSLRKNSFPGCYDVSSAGHIKAGDDYLESALRELSEELGIVAKAPIAQKAIPMCNITYIDGEEMQDKLGGYLEALYEMEPKSVGGALPDEAFYYMAQEE